LLLWSTSPLPHHRVPIDLFSLNFTSFWTFLSAAQLSLSSNVFKMALNGLFYARTHCSRLSCLQYSFPVRRLKTLPFGSISICSKAIPFHREFSLYQRILPLLKPPSSNTTLSCLNKYAPHSECSVAGFSPTRP